jgi:PAS domain S-box-containing protein
VILSAPTGHVPYLITALVYLFLYIAAGRLLGDFALSVFGNAAIICAAAIVTVTIVRRRRQWSGCQRLFWDTFLLGMVLWLIGHFGWAYDDLVEGHASWLEWHTVFTLSGGIGPLVALIARPERGTRPYAVPSVSVDVASYGLLAAFIYVYFGLVPSVTGAADGQRFLLAVVQLHRFLLMAGVLAGVFAARGTPWHPVYVRLAAGAVGGFFLRGFTNSAIQSGAYRVGTTYDFAWILPFLCYAWAARSAPASDEHDESLLIEPSPPFTIVSATPLLLVPLVGYVALRFAPFGPPAIPAVLTSLATVACLALLTLRLIVQRGQMLRAGDRVRLLAAATEQSGDLIAIARQDGSFEHANDAWFRALGFSRREMRLLRFPFAVDGASAVCANAIAREVREAGLWRGTLHRRRRDGSAFPAACTIVGLKDARGETTHFVDVGRDITEEIKLRDQLVHTERLSAIGELVAGVAHEINNPLQTILGSVELMLDERSKNSVSSRDLELVRREAGRAGSIIRNLLAFVRRSPSDRVAADLNDVVRQTAELRLYHLHQRNIELQVRCSPEPLMVFVNREEIQQIVLNLLLNAEHAFSAADASGRITVRTFGAGSSQVVEVADDGPGVPAELKGRIFEPFFTTRDVGKGTGLGLSISHGIAAAHGGQLELLDSASGACFRLALPVHHSAPAASNGDGDYGTIAHRLAMVIDDEEPIRRLLGKILERRGFEVLAVDTGDAALAALDGLRPGLVVCDMRMPGISGAELFERMRARDETLARRFVFITGDTALADARRDGIPDVTILTKPFTAADLDAVLHRLNLNPHAAGR